jgi:DNA-directed RNA polymerase specialized sigma24 family protein
MKRERDPTPEEFEKLLSWLDSDRDVAGKKYEIIRSRLMRIFVCRGCVDAETLADEVMNRIAVRMDKVVETYEGERIKCFLGFADNVYREYVRGDPPRSDTDPQVLPEPSPDDEQESQTREEEEQCLTRCMGELKAAESDLFRRYFQEIEPAKIRIRKRLASELRLSANALRIKAHRIRKELRTCMELCLKEVRV